MFNDVVNSLTFQKLNSDNEMIVSKLILIGKSLKEKQLFNFSYTFLKYAEKKALKFELYELLNLIYDDIIKLSYKNNEINVEPYLKKRKRNKKQLNHIQEIDGILAAVNYRLRKTQNYQSATPKIVSMLEYTLNEFSNSSRILKSEKLKIRIIQSTSKILLQKRNYFELEVFLKHSLADFEKEGIFNKKITTLNYKL